jgi:hypothetical protein
MTSQADIDALRLTADTKRGKLNGIPVVVRISAVDSQAYIWLPQKVVEDAYGNVSYENDILSAKEALIRGMHLEVMK